MKKPPHTSAQLHQTPGGGPSPVSPFGSTDLVLLLMTCIWGANFIAIKYSLVDMWPLSFNGVRFTLASLVLLTAMRATGHSFRVPRRDAWRLFGFGLLANAAYQTLFIKGVASTRVGNASLIAATTPLFIALISRLRGQEYFTSRGVTGLLMAFAGLVLVILSGHSLVEFGQTVAGDLLLLGSAISWSIYTVGARPLIHTYGSMKATALMMLMGTPAFLVICAPDLLRQDWRSIRPIAWGGLIFSALLAIALAHFIWNYAVRKIGSTRTAIYANVTPVVAMLIAWPLLGEVPTWGQVAGAVVIFTGIYLVRTGMQARAPEEIIEEMEEASLGPGKN